MDEVATIRYVECPRDSWQALPRVIPVAAKRSHIVSLLRAGFRTIDLGSFVSPVAVPQLADTEQVVASLERSEGVDFLCVVVNKRGLERAGRVEAVSTVGYPLSINETFQRRNAGSSLEDSWSLIAWLRRATRESGLRLIVYLSMGFGNPYGDPWHPSDTAVAVLRLRELGVEGIVLADTIGSATPERLGAVLNELTEIDRLGLHLHARSDSWEPRIRLALDFGIRWFEGALAGIGGCPFAQDELVGNLPTELVLPWFARRGFESGVELSSLPRLADRAANLSNRYGFR
ncbi:MAG: hydroxymethylglutaryl-CoA lyase [Trueperaceae bacterium]|nr:MAG: hydroxymethylglutaryl-CoA lyase [Trueperaceae bacterium]